MGLHRRGSGGRTTQLRPAANNLAAAGVFFSNMYISCMYKSAHYFPYSAFWEKCVRAYRCGVGLHCEQFLVIISKGAKGNLP